MSEEYQDRPVTDTSELHPKSINGEMAKPEGEVLTIKKLVWRTFKKTDDKPEQERGVLLFVETSNYLTLSCVENQDFVFNTWGKDGQNCIGQRVCVFQVDTKYAGKKCKGVRIRLPDGEPVPAPAPGEADGGVTSEGGEEPPF